MAARVFTQTFGAAGAILEKDGKILLIQEGSMLKEDAGKWNHPAGWIDVGDNPINTAIKEVKEETGLDFTPTALLGVYSLVREDLRAVRGGQTPHAIKLLFKGTFTGEPRIVTPDEIKAIKWWSPGEIDAMPPHELRDLDIKQAVKDYFAGAQYPLELVHHTISRTTEK